MEKIQFLGVEALIASPSMCELFAHVRKAAQTEDSILLLGESGSGKETIARAIHHHSPRKDKPFLDLSCAALPPDLVEAELFGHERGAFSGASATKQGLLELAHQGSLFLSDVSTLHGRLQSKLLRAIKTGSFYRIGAVRPTRANVRLIAANHNEISWCRITLKVPPLRERHEEIEALANYFLAQQNPELKFASDAIMALYSYQWPGNVRELRNTVLRSALQSKGPLLHADDIVFHMPTFESNDCGIEGLEIAMIRRALEDCDGHRQRTADSLGISRSTLTRKIRDYGLSGSSV